ncbi:unnamed protein product, partial [Laminaria digitata]
MANHFLSELVGACKRGDGDRRRWLDWRKGLEVLREAKLAGVEISPALLLLLLSRVPPGNSRKISHLVSSKGSRLYGFRASPDMLAMAAVAHWKEGVVSGAARHLNEMDSRSRQLKKEMLASPSPLVEEWLAVETRGVYASPSRPPRQWQWPWRLVVVDIYGRAGRWAKVSSAFDAFLGEMTFPPSGVAGDAAAAVAAGGSAGAGAGAPPPVEGERVPQLARLPLPEEWGGSVSVVVGSGNTAAATASAAAAAATATGKGVSAADGVGEVAADYAAAGAAAAVEPWASVHPSPLAHAVTAYLKHGRVEEAAQALSFLRDCLAAAGGRAESFVDYSGGGGGGGDGGYGDGGSGGGSGRGSEICSESG